MNQATILRATPLLLAVAIAPVQSQSPGTPPRTVNQSERVTLDKELVLDANELTSVYRQAMEPLQRHLEASTLEPKYRELARVLESDQINGAQLLDALRDLNGELDAFLSGLPEIRENLWGGAEDLGARIDDFRQVIARDYDSKEESLDPADRASDVYLRDLADQILDLPEGPQREVLEQRFEAISLLIDRTASATPDLAGADEAILSNVLKFLVSIRSHLEIAAIRTSEITVALRQQRELIDKFGMLIENLQATDQLAETIEELTSTSAPTFAELSTHMGMMTKGLLTYTDQLNERAQAASQRLAVSAAQGGSGVLGEAELQRRILEASSRGLAGRQNPVLPRIAADRRDLRQENPR